MSPTNGHGGSAVSGHADKALAGHKAALRRLARERRAAAHARQGHRAARTVMEVFSHAVPMPVSSVVSGYIPIGDELDPLPLMGSLLARGLTCAVPVIVGPKRPLVFREWQPGMPLEKKEPYGIPEPGEDAFEVRPTVLLVPMLAFDRAGRRMGYGGGFYDRTLAAYRADAPVLAVGLAFAEQEVDAVPADRHDERLDWIVTEREALYVAPPGDFSTGLETGASAGDALPDDFLKP